MFTGYHHVVRRKQRRRTKGFKLPDNNSLKKALDTFVYVTAIFAVIGNVPQLMKIWIDKSVSGVSLVTWVGFFAGSMFWLFYGLVHRERPIIFSNFFLAIIQSLIVLGLILHN